MRFCTTCKRSITLAQDDAWVDASGACGCGDGEHSPEPDPYCPCESSHCDHRAGECQRSPEGNMVGRDPIMLFLGPCCRQCAETMVRTGGAQYVMVPIGTATQYVG